MDRYNATRDLSVCTNCNGSGCSERIRESMIRKSDIMKSVNELEELLEKLPKEYKDGNNIDYARGAIAKIAQELRQKGSE